MATIRTAADRVTATVAAHGHVKQGQYGEYQSVLFEGPGLPEGKIWRAMDPDQAQQFYRGQQVFLVPTTNKNGKPSWDIEILDQQQPAPQTQQQPAPMATAPTTAPTAGPAPTIPDDRKRAIAQYLQDLAALYAYSYSTAKHQLEPHEAPAEAVQAAASTLFIAASRKFNL